MYNAVEYDLRKRSSLVPFFFKFITLAVHWTNTLNYSATTNHRHSDTTRLLCRDARWAGRSLCPARTRPHRPTRVSVSTQPIGEEGKTTGGFPTRLAAGDGPFAVIVLLISSDHHPCSAQLPLNQRAFRDGTYVNRKKKNPLSADTTRRSANFYVNTFQDGARGNTPASHGGGGGHGVATDPRAPQGIRQHFGKERNLAAGRTRTRAAALTRTPRCGPACR